MECYDQLPMNRVDTELCQILTEAVMRLFNIWYNKKSENLDRALDDII